jgi:hypothetical protein
MLILNGKFPITNLLTVLLALLLAFGAANAHVAEVKAGARAPDAVASEFYGWYLDTLSADQDPLSDRYEVFSRYVAKELSARLIERLQGGKLPQRDYFTQSGSYRVAWQGKVRAATMRLRAGAADVVVTLGDGAEGDENTGGPRQVLALSMVLEGGVWKIRRVAAVDAYGSSPEQPVI